MAPSAAVRAITPSSLELELLDELAQPLALGVGQALRDARRPRRPGVSTRNRPAMDSSIVTRAPLVPIGFLTTWTSTSWPGLQQLVDLLLAAGWTYPCRATSRRRRGGSRSWEGRASMNAASMPRQDVVDLGLVDVARAAIPAPRARRTPRRRVPPRPRRRAARTRSAEIRIFLVGCVRSLSTFAPAGASRSAIAVRTSRVDGRGSRRSWAATACATSSGRAVPSSGQLELDAAAARAGARRSSRTASRRRACRPCGLVRVTDGLVGRHEPLDRRRPSRGRLRPRSGS